MDVNLVKKLRPRKVMPASAVLAAAALVLAVPNAASPCFGPKLKIGVSPDRPASALAAYAAGYYIEEKTGIRPEFVELDISDLDALTAGTVDLLLAANEGGDPPPSILVKPAGTVPGMGTATFWIRADVVDDIRFFTVGKALAQIHEFFASEHFEAAARGGAPPKKLARRAVLSAN